MASAVPGKSVGKSAGKRRIVGKVKPKAPKDAGRARHTIAAEEEASKAAEQKRVAATKPTAKAKSSAVSKTDAPKPAVPKEKSNARKPRASRSAASGSKMHEAAKAARKAKAATGKARTTARSAGAGGGRASKSSVADHRLFRDVVRPAVAAVALAVCIVSLGGAGYWAWASNGRPVLPDSDLVLLPGMGGQGVRVPVEGPLSDPPAASADGRIDDSRPIVVPRPPRRPEIASRPLDALIDTLIDRPVSRVESLPPADPTRFADRAVEPEPQRGAETVATIAAAPTERDETLRTVAAAPRDQGNWREHAVPVAGAAGRPRIAVVIDDLGLNPSATRRLAAMPGPMTMALLPYGTGLAEQSRLGRASGHEILLHMPMQPRDGSIDPGPDALTVGLSEAEIRRRVGAALERFPNAVGLNNHMGSRFTAWETGMAVVADELAERGLLYLDSRTAPDVVGFETALSAGIPAAERHVFLDYRIDPAVIAAQLRAVEAHAQRHGFAVAIGHPHNATLSALEGWLPTLAARGFQLVPISAVVQQRPVAVADGSGPLR